MSSWNKADVSVILQLVLGLLITTAVKLMRGKAFHGISVVFRSLHRRQLLSGADLDRQLSTMTHIKSSEQRLHLLYRYYSICLSTVKCLWFWHHNRDIVSHISSWEWCCLLSIVELLSIIVVCLCERFMYKEMTSPGSMACTLVGHRMILEQRRLT